MAHLGLPALQHTTVIGYSYRFSRSSAGFLDGLEAPGTAAAEAARAASCSCSVIVSAEEGC